MHKNRSCSFILVFLAVFLFAGFAAAFESPLYLPRIPGFKITNAKPCDKAQYPTCEGNIPLGSCDPDADKLQDGDNKPIYQKSCSGQGITRENFKVNVTFDPRQPNPFEGTIATIIKDGDAILPLCIVKASMKCTTNITANQTAIGTNPTCFATCPPGTACPYQAIQNADTCKADTCPWSQVLDTCNSKDNQDESSCGQGTCPNKTGCVAAASRIIVKNPNGCYALEEVQYANGSKLPISFTGSGSSIDYTTPNLSYSSEVGGHITRDGKIIYFKSSAQTIPTSGRVQTVLKDLSGNVIYTKCKDSNGPAKSSNQPTSATGPCDTGLFPILATDGSLITDPGVPVLTDSLYVSSSPSVTPTPSDGVSSCIIGATQDYAQDKYERDEYCNPVRDRYNPADSDATPQYKKGGGTYYNFDQTPSMDSPISVKAVKGVSVAKPVASSLFNAVFYNNPPELQDKIQSMPANSADFDLNSSGNKNIIPGTERTKVSFDVVVQGNNACVYAHILNNTNDGTWRVGTDYPKTPREVYGQIAGPDHKKQPQLSKLYNDIGMTNTCVKIPPLPVNNKPLSWDGSIISDTCTQYDTSASQFRGKDVDGTLKKKAFTGVAVECIRDTMLNLFYPKIAGQETFFTTLQGRLQNTVMLVLALYIIFFGYRLLMHKEHPKKEEWMWLPIKFALVMYFALGTGMTDIFPTLLTIQDRLSIIFMQAGLGKSSQDANIQRYQNDVATKEKAYNEALSELNGGIAASADAARKLTNANQNIASLTEITSDSNSSTPRYGTLQNSLDNYNQNNGDCTVNTTGLQCLRSKEITLLAKENNYKSAHEFSSYSSSGTYIVPAFCTKIKTKVWGGGSAGIWTVGICGESSDVSGSAGGYASASGSVTPGTSYQVTVGVGGATKGGSGSDSSFGNLVTGIGGVLARGGGGSVLSPWVADAISIGATGVSSCGAGQPGTAASGSSQQSASDCLNDGQNQGAKKAPMGGGGCVHDDLPGAWGKGGDGRVEVQCTNFDFTNLQNALSSGQDAKEIAALSKLPSQIANQQNVVAKDIRNMDAANQAYCKELKDYCANIASLRNYQKSVNLFNSNQNLSISPIPPICETLHSYNDSGGTAHTCNETIGEPVCKYDSCSSSSSNEVVLQTNVNNALNDYNSAISQFNLYVQSRTTPLLPGNVGYQYCNFSQYIYPVGKEYMQFWDMIDCKISRYLGIGADTSSTAKPDDAQFLRVILLAPFSSPYGIPILIIGIIFITMLIMMMVRVVHIYILAFIMLISLVYLAPLMVPAFLFKFTSEKMFKAWLNQILLCVLQPILLFACLAFMFLFIDSVMFGGNKSFDINNLITNSSGTTISSKHVTCDDEKAVGCMLQKISFVSKSYPSDLVKVITLYYFDFGGDQGKALCIGIMKLMLIIYIAYSIMELLERITSQLVATYEVDGKGVAEYSSSPVSSPAAIISKMRQGTVKAKNLSAKVGGKVFEAAKDPDKTINSVKRAATKMWDNAASPLSSLRNFKKKMNSAYEQGKQDRQMDDKFK